MPNQHTKKATDKKAAQNTAIKKNQAARKPVKKHVPDFEGQQAWEHEIGIDHEPDETVYNDIRDEDPDTDIG